MQTTLLGVLFFCLFIDLGLVLFTVTRPDRRRTASFNILCFVLTIYTLGYIVEVLATTADEAFLALIMENFAIAQIAPFFFLTSISFFAPQRYRHWQIAVAGLYGVAVFMIVAANPMHGLYYTSIEMIFSGGSHFTRLGRGILFFANQATAFALMLIAYYMLLKRFIRGSRKLRRQMLFFLIGATISFASNCLNITGVLPPGVDPTPIAMSVGLVCFSMSFLQDDLMDVVVRAKDNAVETMDSAFVVVDTDGGFLYCNKAAIRLFPVLRTFQGTEAMSTVEHWPRGLRELREGDELHFELGAEDERSYYRARVRKLFRRSSAMGFSISIDDVTEQTHLIQKLEELATTDPLTGIFNHRYFFELVEREMKIAERFSRTTAFITFDIDHFKRINDEYGHLAGDDVLKELTAQICSQLRVYDVFGRVGGEEFMIFTQSNGADRLVAFAERLRKGVEDMRVMTEKGTICFTASFGICEMLPGAELSAARERADAAMYRAKQGGRNRVELAEAVSGPKSGEELISLTDEEMPEPEQREIT